MSFSTFVGFLLALSSVTGLSVDPSLCRQQQTCGQCQAVSPECSWCSDESYTWDRCDRADYQARSRCRDTNVVNHTSTVNIQRAVPIRGRISISPQYVQTRLYKGRSASLQVQVMVTDKDARRRRISLRPRDVEGVEVSISSNCRRFDSVTNSCSQIRVGQTVEFTLTLTASACHGRQRLRVTSPGLRGRTLRVDVTSQCQCDCETQPTSNDRRCSNNGRFSCGVCQCYRGHYGPNCNCDTDGESRCMTSNSSLACSGRGECICGQCSCHSGASAQHRFYGTFCECNDFTCPFHEGEMCGGADRGQCVCGRCMCVEGYRGLACDQSTDTSTCRSRNGQICNNNGLCLGGVCRCDGQYRGSTCEDCPTCTGRCSELKNCVLCHAFQAGPLSRRECLSQCSYASMTIVDTVNPSEPGSQFCTFVDDNDGSFFFFVYRNGDPVEVKIQREKVFAGR